MFKARFPKFRSFLIFAAAIGAVWIYQQWTFTEETIKVDGKVAQVIDGDSFKAGDEVFRIYGIDAPEYRQTCLDKDLQQWECGKVARSGLDEILRHDEYSCAVHARDQFGRVVVKCTSAAGRDLGAQLVKNGLAASGHYFDETIYAADERTAQIAKRGIWRGEFVRPDIWRQQNPRR